MKKEHFSNQLAKRLTMQKEETKLCVKMNILSLQEKERNYWWLDFLTTDYLKNNKFAQGDFLNCIIGKNLSFRS